MIFSRSLDEWFQNVLPNGGEWYNGSMRIGIDARFFGSLGKGLGRYTQKLIENLETAADDGNDYFVFLRKDNYDEYAPRNPRFRKVLADYHWYTLSEQIGYPKLLSSFDLDLMHFPHFNVPLLYRRRFVVTIHDLILIHFPTIRNTTLSPLTYWLKFLAYRLVIRSAIRRSAKVITVSEFTKGDILENYPGVSSRKVIVTHEAADGNAEKGTVSEAGILSRHGIIKPYVLYVGNAYPHKNLERLAEAFGEARQTNPELSLVIVGKEDYFYRRLKEFIGSRGIDGVIFAGYVTDADLDGIYAEAEAFVFPSLYEGFGLPPLEAMARGVPVLSSDHACMREILGDSALFFDGKDVESMRQAMLRLIEDSESRKKLITSGFSRCERYSWKRMAKETADAYRAAIS